MNSLLKYGGIIYCILVNLSAAKSQVLPEPYLNDVPINFIRTWDAVKPETNPNNLTTSSSLQSSKMVTQYFDGLGRSIQIVMKQGSLNTVTQANVDMINALTYDAFGREQNKYLPFASMATNTTNNDGSFKLNPFQQQASFYNNQLSDQTGETNLGSNNLNFAYSHISFEASPLNRVQEIFAPGINWSGTASFAAESNRNSVKTKYYFNTDVDEVRIWTVSNGVQGTFGNYNSATGNEGIYAQGQLYKSITADEKNNQVIEFKDKDGKVILKKAQLTAIADDGSGSGYPGWLCTYYIYDDFNRLRAVIQPNGVEAIASNWVLDNLTLDGLVFRYEYDARGRLTMKKIPGAGVVQMVYDSRDRMIMTQDANLKDAHQWLVTVYENNLNRPTSTYIITDPANYNNVTYHQDLADVSSNYPQVGNYTNELLSQTHYDDYEGLPSELSNTLNNSGYTTYLTAVAIAPTYAEPITQSLAVKGMITWSKVKVLGTGSQYILTVNIYDEKGRVIQNQSLNASGGLDVITNQYSFSNQLLGNHIHHQKMGAATQVYDVATKNNYDDLGRIASVEKNLNDGNGWKVISSLTYDALGQLNTKKLSPAFKNNAGLQTLKYDYNIRGWLLGMNRDYLLTEGQTTDETHFGFELGYDKTSNKANRNFSGTGELNGNIAGMVWKSDGDDIRRKYDFRYDAVNRLLKADFEQHNANDHLWNNAAVNYSIKMGDGINGNNAYDANGNIKGMVQYGLKIGSPSTTPIDNLSYKYQPGTNWLQQVVDGNNDKDSKLGDFKYDPDTKTDTDYKYDLNGNLNEDKNKKISNITYNYLNLPVEITIPGKGLIKYTYDAAGNKQQKTTTDNSTAGITITTTTNYISGFIYNSKTTVPANINTPDYADVMQFLGQEDGRIRKNTDGTFAYDYFIKDHLGNVRMVLTDEVQSHMYPAATMEDTQTSSEENLYANLNTTRVTKPIDYPGDNTTNPNDKVAKVSAARGAQKVGPSITLKVMSGDHFNLKVSSWYKRGFVKPAPSISPLAELLNALMSGVSGASGGKTAITQLQSSSILTPGATQFLNTQTTNVPRPRAYLNWILFDEQFNFVSSSSGFEQVPAESAFGTVPNQNVYTHVKSNLTIDKSGYLYIYVSNETPNIEVFFDNLQVTHIRGSILEETHYYPFGLTMAGISSKAAGKLENKKKFNAGSELNNDLDISIYETDFRLYDPQIGKFVQPDALAEEFDDWSPYTFANDNPILLNDPTGLASDTAWKPLPEATVTTKQNKSSGYSMVNNPGVNLKKTFDPNTLQVQYNPYRAWEHTTINQHTTGWEMVKTGGEIVTWVFPWGRAIKGVRWIYRANKMRQVAKVATSVSKYLKLFKPQNEFDLVKTLYRGITGSEVRSSILFLTDDAAVAATYIKNGGEVASYELTNFSLKSLQATGELSLKTGMNGTVGAISTEYMFQGKNLVEALNIIAK